MVLGETRSAYPLSKEENKIYAERYGIQEGETVFANFRHDGHWYGLRLPEPAVEKAILQISHFPMPGPFQIAGHLQIQFKCEADRAAAILVPQVKWDVDDAGQPLGSMTPTDVVYSAEAVAADGDESYSCAKGLQNRFAMAQWMVSTGAVRRRFL